MADYKVYQKKRIAWIFLFLSLLFLLLFILYLFTNPRPVKEIIFSGVLFAGALLMFIFSVKNKGKENFYVIKNIEHIEKIEEIK